MISIAILTHLWLYFSRVIFTSTFFHQLRKPAVEKMRRDRINSSIEQLKVLLEKEFHKQQPNVKLEKADILEMAVAYLKQHALPTINSEYFFGVQLD